MATKILRRGASMLAVLALAFGVLVGFQLPADAKPAPADGSFAGVETATFTRSTSTVVATTTLAASSKKSKHHSSKGRRALAYAKRQLGEPYRFAGAGPNHWDCSGLTMKAWGHVGVKLPHNAHTQIHKGKRVSRKHLRLGDLVFFYRGRHHVGIYAGHGKVIHAPRPGERVQYIKIKYMPYAGASRPG